jgi:hypothetical protein
MISYRVDIMKITKGPPFLFNFSILNLADEVVQYLFLVPWMLSYRGDIIKITKEPTFFLIFCNMPCLKVSGPSCNFLWLGRHGYRYLSTLKNLPL